MIFRRTRTFTAGNEIVLLVIPHGRKAEMGDRAGMAMAGQRYCLGGVCLSDERYQPHTIDLYQQQGVFIPALQRPDDRDGRRLTGRHAGPERRIEQ